VPGGTILKPVPTGFSFRLGTPLALRAARAVLRPPRNDTSLRSHRPMAATMPLRRRCTLQFPCGKPPGICGYAGARETSRRRLRRGFVSRRGGQINQFYYGIWLF